MQKLMKYKKQIFCVYLLVCIIYTAVTIMIPYELEQVVKLNGKGNTTAGSISNDTNIEFYYTNKENTLTKMFFFLENEPVEDQKGSVIFQAYTTDTNEEVGALTVDLSLFENNTYVILPIDKVSAGREIKVTVTGSDIAGNPTLAVNTNEAIEAVTKIDGQAVDGNLVAATAVSLERHAVKKPLIRLLLLSLLGLIIFVFDDSKDKEPKSNIVVTSKKSKMNSLLTKIDKRYTFLRPLIGLGIVLFIITVIFYYLYDTEIRKAMNTTDKEVVMEDEGNFMPITADMKEFRQTLIMKQKEAVGLGFKLNIPNSGVMDGDLHIRIINKETEEILCDTNISLQEVLSDEYIGLIFNQSQTDTYGKSFELVVNFPDTVADQTMSLYVTKDGAYADNSFFVDGGMQSFNMGMIVYTSFHHFIRTYFLALYMGICLAAVFLYYLIAVRKFKIETVYLFSLLAIGIIYSFIILPYMAPDEETHIDNAYGYSNILLGYGAKEDGTCLKRQDDALIPLTSEASIDNYKYVYENLFQLAENKNLVETESAKSTGAGFYVYLPAALGVALARILGLGPVLMLQFGRWFSLLAFALLTFLGMRKLPFGKITLFLICILPMTVQQVTSFSYDSVTLGISILFSCYCLSLAFGNHAVKGRDILLLCLLSLGIIFSKGGVYLPIAFAFFLIPQNKFNGKKSYIKAMLLMGLFVLLAFIYRNMTIVTSLGGLSSSESSIHVTGETAYTLGYLLAHPMDYITVIANTIADKSEFYMQSLIGQKLGWVSLSISNVVIVAFIILLLASTLKGRGEKMYFKSSQKVLICLLSAASFGLILTAMLLTWTPVSHISIEGVHGRYFLPFIFLLVLTLRNNKIHLEKNMDRTFVVWGLALQVLAIMYLLKEVIVF